MSSNRVIQDSDDEDDPLSCEAQPPPPVTIRQDNQPDFPAVDDGDIQDAIDESQAQDVNGSYGAEGMSVNFDDFLQPQSQDVDAAQARLSSSQQRREERWIPNGAGIARGSGSIGFMMSEIGLAQKRLFDDDGLYSGQQIPSTAQCSESEPSGPVYFDKQWNHEAGNEDNNDLSYHGRYPGEYSTEVQVPMQSDMPHDWYQFGGDVHGNGLNRGHLVDANGNYSDQLPHTSVSSYDHAQSIGSYDVLTSLEGPADGDPENPTAMSHETIQTERLHGTPNRSKSMQPMLYSPHDTEPLSSLISSNVSRSKSDNVGQQSAPQQQSSMNGSDELSAPVAIEIPMQKKRGRKKKQSQPEGEEEDDELAASHDRKRVYEENKPANRKPGRPRSKVQLVDKADINEPSETYEQTETKAPPSGSDEVKAAEDTPQNPHPENDEIQLVEINIPNNRPAEPLKDTSEGEQIRFAEPAKPTATKEPKKKKLRRGKTTSVTLKKTYEPEVEDDVIWVDERQRPPIPDIRQDYEPTSIPTPDSISVVDEERDLKPATMVEIPNPAPASVVEGDQDVQPEPAPAPKKRGRKRKKTSEQLAAEVVSAEANEHAYAQPDNNVSVVLDRSTTDPNRNNTPNNSANTQPQQQPQSSPTKPAPALAAGQEPGPEPESTSNAPETPEKQHPTPDLSNQQQGSGQDASTKNPDNDDTNNNNRGPDKHSPIAGTSKVPYRVGLSRRARIAPLLKIVKR